MKKDETDPMLVLLDALEQYHANVGEMHGEGFRLFDEARAWFAAHDDKSPLGFQRICADLQLDPERVRATLERRRAQAVRTYRPKTDNR
jgi:hypothetical protein